jgi:hypothetical protein
MEVMTTKTGSFAQLFHVEQMWKTFDGLRMVKAANKAYSRDDHEQISTIVPRGTIV